MLYRLLTFILIHYGFNYLLYMQIHLIPIGVKTKNKLVMSIKAKKIPNAGFTDSIF
jgi:hypothetical protein